MYYNKVTISAQISRYLCLSTKKGIIENNYEIIHRITPNVNSKLKDNNNGGYIL